MTGRRSSKRDAVDHLRVVGYVRVSTEEQGQSGLGLRAQRDAITAEVRRRGWQLVEVIEDSGYSAKNLKRPGVTKALSMLRDGEVDGLVCSKLDRLSRSIVDFAGLLERSQREGWVLRALDIDIDTTTPSGEAMASIMSVFSQLERRLIGERTKAALAIKKSQGVRLGRPRSLRPEVRARILELRSQGLSFAAIAQRLNDDGTPTATGKAKWWPNTVAGIINSVDD
jgi:DNA invertase Pin-like site-specific DNA recombinase